MRNLDLKNKIFIIKKTILKYFFKAILAISVLLILFFMLTGVSCSSVLAKNNELPEVLAAESFLADITVNIAKSRLKVNSLIPVGLDPHGFEPTPADVIKISQCDLFIINGGGFEEWLNPILTDSLKDIVIIEASQGLEFRTKLENAVEHEHQHENSSIEVDEHNYESEHNSDKHSDKESDKEHAILKNDQVEKDNNEHEKEINDEHSNNEGYHNEEKHSHKNDPHFWLNPYLVVTYVNNIKDALIDLDPEAEDFYTKNAQEYTEKLLELDNWIKEEVKKIPQDKRLLITNHESFGYYADRYGFKIIGTIIPSSSTAASPSAREVAELIEKIKALNIKAIFLETGSDPKVAKQIASETGVNIITEIYTNSLTEPGGYAPTYIYIIK